jgi:hypothetical protein
MSDEEIEAKALRLFTKWANAKSKNSKRAPAEADAPLGKNLLVSAALGGGVRVRIVDLAGSVPILSPLFVRWELMMLGARFRIPRYVWNVAKPRSAPGEGRRSGHRKDSDQSDSHHFQIISTG